MKISYNLGHQLHINHVTFYSNKKKTYCYTPLIFQNIVNIDHKTCEVKAVKPLDREKVQQFTLSIVVEDIKAQGTKQTDTGV